MTIYPSAIILQLERLAATAVAERRSALKSIHDALTGDQRSAAMDLRHGMKGQSEDQIRWAQRFLCEQLVLPSENRPNLEKDFTSLLMRWVGSVESVAKAKLTPRAEKQGQAPVSGVLAEIVAVNIKQAIAHERVARSAANELFTASYAGRWPDGSACNPMRETARMVLLKNNSKHKRLKNSDSDAIDELMTEGFQAITIRIDRFEPAIAPFLAWWYKLLSNLDIDRGRKTKRDSDHTNLGSNQPEDRFYVRPAWDEVLFSQPFSEADWSVIQGWKELAVDIPVVLIVGFDWVNKICSNVTHRRNFCQWLMEYGVSDPDACISKLVSSPESTEARFSVLAQCGNKKNSGDIGAKFSRPFAGIHQSAKQTSFGKNHHAVELEFFWKLEWVVGRHASDDTCTRLDQMEVGPRVAALCSAPAWHLIGGKSAWETSAAGYPFMSLPPMLEMLRDDFAHEPVHFKYVPVFVKNTSDVQQYYREQVLVHSTRGNLAAAKDAVRCHRLAGQSMKADLRVLADDSSMPDTKRKQRPSGDN